MFIYKWKHYYLLRDEAYILKEFMKFCSKKDKQFPTHSVVKSLYCSIIFRINKYLYLASAFPKNTSTTENLESSACQIYASVIIIILRKNIL